MHTANIAKKLLLQPPCENEALFTRLPCFGESFQWKLVAVKGKSGVLEVFDWVQVLWCTFRLVHRIRRAHVTKVSFLVNTLLLWALWNSWNSLNRLWACGKNGLSHRLAFPVLVTWRSVMLGYHLGLACLQSKSLVCLLFNSYWA